MLDSYEEGQQLTVDDFIDDYYLPEGEYAYCIVENIEDDIVTLDYITLDGGKETKEWTRSEMEHMLGWDLGDDEDRFDAPEPEPEEYGFF